MIISLIHTHFPEPRVQLASTYHEEPMAELADEIEHVKALILEKLDDLNALRTKLREEYVPLTVCNHLEQCIKETEVPSLFSSSNFIELVIGRELMLANKSEKLNSSVWSRLTRSLFLF